MQPPDGRADEIGRVAAVAYSQGWEEALRAYGQAGMDVRVQAAVHEAVTVLCLRDSADYLYALWAVVRALRPDLARLLARDSAAAYKFVEHYPTVVDLGDPDPETDPTES